MTNESFWHWVDQELENRGLSYYRVEMESGLSNAAISRQARNWTTPTMTACRALAQTFKMPVENVLRRAGLLDPLPPPIEEEREIITILRTLPNAARQTVITMIRALSAAQPARAIAEPTTHYHQREDPEMEDLERAAEELIQIWNRLRYMDPEAAEQLVGIAKSQAAMVLHAARAAQRLEEQGETKTAVVK